MQFKSINMLRLKIILTIVLCTIQFCQGDSDEIQYSSKLVSDTAGDGFAKSLATSDQRLLVGAPAGQGYVRLEPGLKVLTPQGRSFGKHLDFNQQFMAVSGEEPDLVYVFSSIRPYTLVAKIPVDKVWDLKVIADSTILIASSIGSIGYISVYNYDRTSSWDRHQKIVFEGHVADYMSLAVSDDVMAVGYYGYSSQLKRSGRVGIYKRENKEYILACTLPRPEHVDVFGWSVAIEGQTLAVSSWKSDDNIIFTYKFDPTSKQWMMKGRFAVAGPHYYSHISMHQGMLAVAMNDLEENYDVCAYIYKQSNNSTDANEREDLSWTKIATLKTNGEPAWNPQYHSQISVHNGRVFTGRVDYDGYGQVFVHDLNKH